MRGPSDCNNRPSYQKAQGRRYRDTSHSQMYARPPHAAVSGERASVPWTRSVGDGTRCIFSCCNPLKKKAEGAGGGIEIETQNNPLWSHAARNERARGRWCDESCSRTSTTLEGSGHEGGWGRGRGAPWGRWEFGRATNTPRRLRAMIGRQTAVNNKCWIGLRRNYV